MWIIPSNHPLYSAFAPAYLDSKEALKEQLEKSGLQLMWRSKPSSSPTWLQRWKRVYWIPYLFGRMLKPSMQHPFETKYTALLAGIRASPSATPGCAKAKKTRGTSGQTSVRSFVQLSLFGASSKMCGDTLPSVSTWCTKNFQTSVTRWRQEYFQRRKSAQRRKEKDSSSSQWSTPTLAEAKNLANEARMKRNSPELGTQIMNWPTATVHQQSEELETYFVRAERMKERHKGKTGNGVGMSFNTSVKMWPTIQASEARQGFQNRDNGMKGSQKSLTTVVTEIGRQGKDLTSTNGKSQEQLNPAWVAQLMGTTFEQTFFVHMVTP